MQYYDEVQKRFALVTNTVVMSHEHEAADLINIEIRTAALHTFISGLKNQLRAIVFPAQLRDLSSTLTLAKEAEDSIERSMFANSYAKVVEERNQAAENSKNLGQEKTPHFKRKKDTPLH